MRLRHVLCSDVIGQSVKAVVRLTLEVFVESSP